MPTEKRERQRAGRESRRAAAREAQKRAARRRQIISIVVLLAVVAGVGFVISRSGSETDATKNAAADAGETSDASDTKDKATEEDAKKSETAAGSAECPPVGGSDERRTSFDGPPKMCIDPAQKYSAEVQTDIGKFTIDLDASRAPKTVNNFVFLSRYRYYDGVPFHRVIPDFVVQGGDAEKENGTGGPGYKFEDELPKAGEYKTGSVAMANSGPNTNGSQFYIVVSEAGAAKLQPLYSLFGTVVQGMEVVKAIEADGTESGQPRVTHKITKVTITEKDG